MEAVKISLFVFLALFFGNSCLDPGKDLSKREALEDLSYLRNKIEEIHPHRFFAITEQQEVALFDSIRGEVKGPISIAAFYNCVARYSTCFKDGHTFPSMRLVEQWYEASLGHGNTVLPVEIDFREDWWYLKAIYNDQHPDLIGSKLLSVNGIDATDIIERFQQYYAKRAHLLDNAHARLFRAYFWKAFGDYRSWALAYELPNGQRFTLEMPGLSAMEWNAWKRSAKGSVAMTPPYTFQYLFEEKVGLLTINFMGEAERFDLFVREVFRELKERSIQYLVIDMRQNGGGTSRIGDALYAYLSNKPYLDGKMYVKTSRTIKEWYRSQRQGHPLYDLVTNGADGALILYPDTVPVVPAPVDFPFRGKTFLMTSKKTFSSGHMFVGNFKCNDIGVVVGQETGQATKTVGDAFNFRLPHSGIDISVSYKIFESACELSFTQGFHPHHKVVYSPAELNAGKDKELEIIHHLIYNQ